MLGPLGLSNLANKVKTVPHGLTRELLLLFPGFHQNFSFT